MTDGIEQHVNRHLRFGWWSLAFFVAIGLALEALHGLKLGFYLDVHNETRRLMWTLGHAHGTLLSLVNLAFAAALPRGWTAGTEGSLRAASACLRAATILLPGGFLLGGVSIYEGDPGLGILLVPLGALLLLAALVTTARRLTGPTG